MKLTKDQIENLPVITENEDMFYADGEFESVLLADFKEDADRIDAGHGAGPGKPRQNRDTENRQTNIAEVEKQEFESFDVSTNLLRAAADCCKESPDLARFYLTFAAMDSRNPELLYVLGHMEVYGEGGDANIPDGISHLGQSAGLGNPDACFELGSIYYWGKIVDTDYRKAFSLFQKAANLGHAESCNYLAECYKEGKGVERDPALCTKWLGRYIELKSK